MQQNLRRDLQETNERISKIDKDLSAFKEIHGGFLEKYENFGDQISDEIKNRKAAESSAAQAEKRAIRSENEEKRLREQFERLSLRKEAAEKSLQDKQDGRDRVIDEEIIDLHEVEVRLLKEVEELKMEAKVNGDAADQIRLNYQQESTNAAELCREVQEAKEIIVDLEHKALGEAMRLRAEQRDMDLQARDNVIDEMTIQISNLEDTLRRLELDQQQRIAKYAVSRPANGYSSRRTRSPAVSTLARGCSPGTFGNQQANGSHNTSSSNSSSGHPLQQSQKV